MNAATVIAVIALLVIVTLAVSYIVREKKRGTKCIGCPYAGSCTKHDAMSGAGCGAGTQQDPDHMYREMRKAVSRKDQDDMSDPE